MKKKQKRFITIVLAILSLLIIGCKNKTEEERIIITVLHHRNFETIEKLVEDTYPNIDIKCETFTYQSEITRRLENNVGSDLIVFPQPDKNDVLKYFYNMSATTAANRYDSNIIQQYNYDGSIYMLPLPGNYWGYIINKTFLDQLDLAIPTTNEELIETLQTLKENGLGVGEDNLNFGMRCESNNYLGMYYAGYMIPDYLGTINGVEWLSKFINKEAKFVDTWNNVTKFTDQLISLGLYDSDIITQKKNSLGIEQRMAAGELAVAYGDTAMYNKIAKTNFDGREVEEEYEYVMIPFLSDSENKAWTTLSPEGFIGINKNVDSSTLDYCLKILDIISSNEGQAALIKDLAAGVSYVKSYNQEVELPDVLADTVSAGYVYTYRFPSNIIHYIGYGIKNYYAGNVTLEEALTTIDEFYYAGKDPSTDDIIPVGIVNKNLLYQNYNTRRQETEIGNFVADSVKEASKADIALVNGGGIRTSIYEGEVYKTDLTNVCPHSNLIVVLEVDGKTLWDVLENSLELYNESFPAGRFLQVSGIKYTFDSSKEVGNMLESIKLDNGEEIQMDQKYKIAVNDYMAGKSGYLSGNGDGFYMINIYDEKTPKNPNVSLISETNLTYAQALELYFINHVNEIISPKLEGRIVDLNENKEN